jgi:diguanylate cyclase (GGDEF)-like protein/PAS domain S-box-containing protein
MPQEEGIAPLLVLLIDADGGARAEAQGMLQDAGIAVCAVADPREARHELERAEPDIVLWTQNPDNPAHCSMLCGFNNEAIRSDIIILMPEKGNSPDCDQLCTKPGRESIPVISIVPANHPELIKKSYAQGAVDCVVQQVNWLELIPRLQHLHQAANTSRQLAESQKRLADVQRIAGLGYWDWDIVEDKIYVSDELCRIFGRPKEHWKGIESMFRSIHPRDQDRVQRILQDHNTKGKPYDFEFRVIHSDDSVRVVHAQGEVTSMGDANPVWAAGTVEDISEARQRDATIRKLAYIDSLTGLHNRAAFCEQLNEGLLLAKEQGSKLAVISLDVDNFQRINASLGHYAGDHLLKEIAERLQLGLRSGDVLMRNEVAENVARLGGDEFTISLNGITSSEDAALIAQRILDDLSEPFHLPTSEDDTAPSHEFFTSVSIGIAIYPDDGLDAAKLLKHADTAMYAAKKAGKNRFQFYAGSMNATSMLRLNLEARLRKAIEGDELILHYQPKIDMASGRVMGLEALVRWQNPELGLVSPGEFIPLAEETGLIIPIGAWVLEAACTQAMNWREEEFDPLTMAVNLSGLQFRRPGLSSQVRKVLMKTGLPPEYLELELTESILMGDTKGTITALHELKEMGLKLSVDDFGTGYSSLSYLKHFPLDYLKIDRSFVRDIEHERDDAALTNAIITMAHGLGLKVIAEGIENITQLVILRAQLCDIAQGFLFSKPIPANEVLAFVTNAYEQGLPGIKHESSNRYGDQLAELGSA